MMKQKVVSGFLMVVCFVAGICMLISGLVSLAGKSGYEKTKFLNSCPEREFLREASRRGNNRQAKAI